MNIQLQNTNETSKENQKLFSTPKFRKYQQDKDKEIYHKNNPLNIETLNLDDSKKNIQKNIYLPYDKEEIKESNDGFLFKDNFSLSSLLDNCENNISNNFTKDKNGQKDKALISFCDKNENNSFNNENNEIIYKEKENNSSTMTNKEKEMEEKGEKNLMINSFSQSYEMIDVKNCENDKNSKLGGKTNLNLNNNSNNISIEQCQNTNSVEMKEINTLNTKQNGSSSFKYNLPLENDKVSFINGFMEYEKNEKENNDNKIINEIQSLNSENDIINNEDKPFKLNIEKNKFLDKRYMTYSKKKVKRNNIERVNKTYKKLPILLYKDEEEKENDNNNEIKKDKSLIEKGINKITIKKNILNSCGNYNKIKTKIKKSVINISTEGNKDKDREKDELFFSERANYNTISPKGKLKLIIKKTKIDLNDNNKLSQTPNYMTSREKLLKSNNTIMNDQKINNINYFKKNFNSFSTKQKKNKNRKLIKSSYEFHNTLFNFKVKNLPGHNIENENLSKELNNDKEINVIDVSHKQKHKLNNTQKIDIYKKSHKNNLISNNKQKIHSRTRNTSDLYFDDDFNRMNDLLNNDYIFTSINYEDNSLNNYINNNRNTFLYTQGKQKFEIKRSLIPMKKTLSKKIKFTNNKQYNKDKCRINNNKLNLKSNNNKNPNKINKSKGILYKNNNYIKGNKKNNNNKFSFFNTIDINKIKNNNININNNTYNKPNNLVSNHVNNRIKIIKKQKEIFNTINCCNTDRYNKDSINKKNIFPFSSINNSSNSLKPSNQKIKVNMLIKHNKIISSPILNQNKNYNFWKIYKKPKNSCLLNKLPNNVNSNVNDSNKISNKTLSQYVLFKESRIKNNIKENENSLSYNTNYYFNNQRNESHSINEINNKEKDNYVSRTINRNKIYQNKKNINKTIVNRNKSNKIRELLSLNNNSLEKNETIIFSDDIIKLSILRNNLNNKIIKEFSVVVGDETIRKENDSNENQNINNFIVKKETDIPNINKKTIINVNQYYPKYYINDKLKYN